ncbi:MAG: hypothetical protein BIFFINMI_03400 [Phycisphaerae bacterium]|nr:hypothetical protein [Phycisphaerae bacterium]
MDIRVVTHTRPGRPVLALVLMAFLLAASVAAAWMVSRHKAVGTIDLGTALEFPGLPLKIRPPLEWRTTGPIPQLAQSDRLLANGARLLAQSFDPEYSPVGGGQAAPVRRLGIYVARGVPGDAGDALARLLNIKPGDWEQELRHVAIGPLPARQIVLSGSGPQGMPQHILLRVAPLGDGHCLLLELDCVGPPMPRELRMMNTIAANVHLQAAPDASAAADLGLKLGPAGNRWLVRARNGYARQLTFVPLAADASAAASLPWMEMTLTVAPVRGDQDLAALLSDYAQAGLGGMGLGGRMAPWPPMLVAPPLASQADRAGGAVTAETLGGTALLRYRQTDDDAAQNTWLFHAHDDIGTVRTDRAVWLRVWCSAEDEDRAVSAARELLAGLQLIDGGHAGPPDAGADLSAAEELGARWVTGAPVPDYLRQEFSWPYEMVLVGQPETVFAEAIWSTYRWDQTTPRDASGAAVPRKAEVKWTPPHADAPGDFDQQATLWVADRISAELRCVSAGGRIEISGRKGGTSKPFVGQFDRRTADGGADAGAAYANYLPYPMLRFAAASVAHVGHNSDDNNLAAAQLSFRVAGPSADRLARVFIQPGPDNRAEQPQALAWFDYDPDPVLIEFPAKADQPELFAQGWCLCQVKRAGRGAQVRIIPRQ